MPNSTQNIWKLLGVGENFLNGAIVLTVAPDTLADTLTISTIIMASKLTNAVKKGERDTVYHVLYNHFFGYSYEAKKRQKIHTEFCNASQTGNIGVVEVFLQFGVTCNEELVSKALMLAASNGHVAVVEVLLEHDVPIDYLNECGKTALMLAAENGYADVVDVLLKNGAQADLQIQSQGGSTALMYACEAREEYASVVEVLLLHHARVDISGQSGHTALSLAALRGYASIVDHLLKHDALAEGVLQTTQFGRDALLYASQEGP